MLTRSSRRERKSFLDRWIFHYFQRFLPGNNVHTTDCWKKQMEVAQIKSVFRPSAAVSRDDLMTACRRGGPLPPQRVLSSRDSATWSRDGGIALGLYAGLRVLVHFQSLSRLAKYLRRQHVKFTYHSYHLVAESEILWFPRSLSTSGDSADTTCPSAGPELNPAKVVPTLRRTSVKSASMRISGRIHCVHSPEPSSLCCTSRIPPWIHIHWESSQRRGSLSGRGNPTRRRTGAQWLVGTPPCTCRNIYRRRATLLDSAEY